MDTFVILRRSGWADKAELDAAGARSTSAAEHMAADITWLRSYVLVEPDGRLGTVCVYQATDPDAIRRHANAADLPVDEIVPVAGVVVVNADPEPPT